MATQFAKLIQETILYVLGTLGHNAPSLFLGTIIAALISIYIDPEKMKGALLRKAGVSIPGSVAFGAFTPFCACGTMAVIISLMTTVLPWGPIMAFLASSPLMSPDHFILVSGIIGVEFAVALAAASVIIGLGSGYLTHYIEKHTSFLVGEARLSGEVVPAATVKEQACACEETGKLQVSETSSCACSSSKHVPTAAQGFLEKYKLRELLGAVLHIGIRKVLLYFSVFAAIGYIINRSIPASLIMALFSADNVFSVPLAAITGLPLYVSGTSSLPIIKVFMEAGAGGGAMLAFMITGPGTSAGVITGIATIMKKKAIALYITFILGGGVLFGYIYDLFLFLSGR